MRILVFNPYGIGDVLCSLALVSALKSAGNEIFYICNRRSKEVLENHPDISQIILYERDEIKASIKGWFSFINQIRKLKADLAVDLTLNRNLSFLLFLVGIKNRVGLDYKNRGIFLTKKKSVVEFVKNVAEEYFDLYYLIFGDSEDVSPSNFYPKIYLSAEEERFAHLLFYNLGLKKDSIVISVFPGGGASWGKHRYRKQWPAEKFLELIVRLLLKNEQIVIMVMGDEDDRSVLTIPMTLLRSRRCFDLRGKLRLREAISVIKASSLVISNDGGPAHITAAVGGNLVSIMGPVPEVVYSPFGQPERIKIVTSDVDCRPCYRRFRMPECQNEFRCLKEISVEDVLSAADDFLKR